MNATAAYREAYPESTEAAARSSASELLTKPNIKAEIQRIRDKGDAVASKAAKKLGYIKLCEAQKRDFLARTVEARITELPHNSDLYVSVKHSKEGTEFRLGDKLAAIKLDNDLAGEGSEASADDAFTELLQGIVRGQK